MCIKAKYLLAPAQLDSFVHLHLGIDARGLPSDLECHHLVVNSWQDITAPQVRVGYVCISFVLPGVLQVVGLLAWMAVSYHGVSDSATPQRGPLGKQG